MKILWASRAGCFICEIKNSVLNSFTYIKAMKIFKYRNDMMEFSSFSDSTSCIIKIKLKTTCLSG